LKLLLDGPRAERIAAAEADMRAAEARLKRSKWRLDNCIITSPVNGVILTKKAEIGSLINPVVGSVSTGLCEIADLTDLEVDLEIQERDISKVFEKQYCRIKSDAYPDRPYIGYVDRQMPIANRARGIIPVRVKVIVPSTEKPGAFLKPEMGVSVTFFNKPFETKPVETKPVEPKTESAPANLPQAEKR
jgi:HlyD family secretion protein